MRKLDAIEIESAISEVKGDRLLLTLAIDKIEEAASAARDRGGLNGGSLLELQVDEDDLAALAHAHVRLICAVRDLEKTFDGEPQP